MFVDGNFHSSSDIFALLGRSFSWSLEIEISFEILVQIGKF